MESNVKINNLCSWPLYFKRYDGQGDIKIPANAKNHQGLTFNEVKLQIQNGNSMFTGTDGMGAHARIEIADEEQRKKLFEIEGTDIPAPILLTEAAVTELLAIRTKAKFNERLNSLVTTDAEKRCLVEMAFAAGANDAENWKVEALRQLANTAKL